MSPERALASLPHGPEFRFIDALTRLEPGRAGAGTYRFRGTEGFVPGHFPGNPILPAVILVEAIAQLAGVIAQSDPAIPPFPGVRLAAIRGAKILAAVVPGEILHLEAEITGRIHPLVQARGTVRTGERLVAQAEVTLAGMSEA